MFGSGQTNPQLGIKRTQSFSGTSTQSGAFGSQKPAQSSGLFGSQPAQTGAFGAQQNQTGQTGLFGAQNNQTTAFGSQSSQPTQPAQSGGLFGSQTQPAQTGGLLGNKSQPNLPNQPNQPQTGGIFGNQSQAGQTGGLFGAQNKPAQTGGLFGNQTQTAQPAQQGGLFGSQAGQAGQANGLLGAQNKPTTGGMFGSQTQPAQTGGLFGNQTQPAQTGGLFGNQTKPAQTGGLFGAQNQTQPAQTGGLFGTQNQTQPAQTGGLFGSQTQQPQNGLFGTQNRLGQPAGGAFGNQTQTGGLFNAQQGQQAQQGLMTYVDQASYTLQGVTPSQKLYTSLTVPNKRTRDSGIYDFASRPTVSRSRIASSYTSQKQELISAPAGPSSVASIGSSGAGSLIPAGTDSATSIFDRGDVMGNSEHHKWINSYDEFMREQPTTLQIRKDTSKSLGIASLQKFQKDLLPVSTGPAVIGTKALDDETLETNTDSVFEPERELEPRPTIVKVSKQVIEEGYYSYPSLEALAVMSRQELSAVKGLIIGREKFGQIKYLQPVDLSHLSNLGDLLGSLVVFQSGTVCVYPDESNKKPMGTELNLPCTVTIERCWPRDAKTHRPIKNMEDSRMQRFISRLHEACESRGGEFIAYSGGVWVFKVPHFSKWGITEEETIEDDSEVSESDTSQFEQELEKVDADVEMQDSTSIMEEVFKDEDRPLTWAEQISATKGALFNMDSAVFDAISKPTQELDIESIVMPLPKESKDINFEEDSAIDGLRLEALSLSSLQPYMVKESREGSDIPLLSTNVHFTDLYKMLPLDEKYPDLWYLLSTLYESKSDDVTTELSKWFDKRVSQLPFEAATDSLNTVYQYLARHKVDEAYNVASNSADSHTALLVALISDASQMQQLNENAKGHLKLGLPEPDIVKDIWKVAAGLSPRSSVNTWPEWLGMRFWYSWGISIKEAVASLPASLDDKNFPELCFLRIKADLETLGVGLQKLDVVDRFLCLQALKNAGRDYPDADDVYENLADQLNEIDEHISSVYVALHISDSDRANAAVRRALLHGAVNVMLPAEFGMPENILNEVRAYQVSQIKDYVAQAEYLVRAGKYNEAHEVVVATVGPNAVLEKRTNQIVDLLANLEKHKDSIRDWNLGGYIYLAYARALLMGTDNQGIKSIAFECKFAAVPNLTSKRAISKIAEWVATNSNELDVDQVMEMKFDPTQRRIQALQQSARLLL